MNYNYQITSDFNVGELWILNSLGYDDVFFRFILETYRGVTKSVWMSPHQALEYIRYRTDDITYGYSFKIVKRFSSLHF